MIEIFKITFEANETREVAISGEYFEVRNANSPIDLVELCDRSGVVVSSLKNPDQSDFVRPGKFETLRVKNGATAQTCKFFIGSGDAGSRHVAQQTVVVDSAKNIVVIDTAKQLTIDGFGFSQFCYMPNAGGFPHLQLWNPPSSGKNLIIDNIGISSAINTVSSVYAFGFKAETIGVPYEFPSPLNNKSESNKNSVASFRVAYSQDMIGILSRNSQSLFSMGVVVGGYSNEVLNRPFVLTPGYGIVALQQVVNTHLSVRLAWTEVNV